MQSEFRYVSAVSESGSFSKAAQTLGITQPALSLAIQKIERELGAAIFDRTRHPLTVTAAGKIFIAAARKNLLIEEQMRREIAELKDLKKGTLRVGGSSYLMGYFLAPLLAEFSSNYPGVTLELVEGSADELVAMLSRGQIDVTFSCNPAAMTAFDHTRAFSDEILLAVSPLVALSPSLRKKALTSREVQEGTAKSKASVRLSEFAAVPFILLTPGNNLSTRAGDFFAAESLSPRVQLRVSQLATAEKLTGAFAAATFVSDRQAAHNDGLVYFRLNHKGTTRQFEALLPREGFVPYTAQAFVRLMQR